MDTMNPSSIRLNPTVAAATGAATTVDFQGFSPAREGKVMFQLRYAAGVVAAMFLFAVHAEGATYYVSTSGNDANPGSQTQAFRTIRKGLSVLGPGDTLYVRGGTYTEQLFEVYFGSSGT